MVFQRLARHFATSRSSSGSLQGFGVKPEKVSDVPIYFFGLNSPSRFYPSSSHPRDESKAFVRRKPRDYKSIRAAVARQREADQKAKEAELRNPIPAPVPSVRFYPDTDIESPSSPLLPFPPVPLSLPLPQFLHL
ncbi:hypothetical protein N7456_000906 [Penicillium angulare]|uniref:Uncharacterized protein n=1 Tax=Penicillium angulare TaxID=116970 RepID=A0A9W9GED5_9EURO|nr:hypothetical protein N7456_000906 [Penicillium angulare]